MQYKLANFFVKNTRYSCGYASVFYLKLDKLYPHFQTPPYPLIGIRHICICLILVGFTISSAPAQLSYLNHDPLAIHLLDRLETLGQRAPDHLTIRRQNLYDIITHLPTSDSLSQIDRHDWDRLIHQIPEGRYYNPELYQDSIVLNKGILGTFYKTPYSFFTIDTDDFYLKIDPILQFGLGDDTKDDRFVFQNTRGIELRGTIDKKVYFYTSILENQQRFYNYIEDEISRINAIPGQGFFKTYQSGIIDRVNGWDFLNAQAYAGLKISKSIDTQLGHGRHFIGDGIRSMLLSDYANNYFYLQFNTKVWKLHYQNTFAELSVNSSRDNIGNQLLPKKYMATHYLNYQANSKLTIGLFESVIFSRENNFEFQYLNPLILYRSVEQFLDSPDNVILGMSAKWVPRSKYQLYGQILIDELRTDQAFSGRGWWGNKIGYQLGLKKFDLLAIDHLDIQLEYNSARPYTYAHRDQDPQQRPTTSYAHFNQALAHPYGANFREFIIQVKYRPHPRLYVDVTLLRSSFGTDQGGNVGRDILSNYEDRVSDFGNVTGQGVRNNVVAFHVNGSWEIFHNYFVDLQYIFRNQKIENQSFRKTNYIGIGFRANIHQRTILL